MRVECLWESGLGGYLFAGGVIRLVNKINAQFPQCQAKHYTHLQTDDLRNGVENRFRKFGPADYVIFGGHSWGGKEAAEVAHWYINLTGKPVDRVFGIDVTATFGEHVFVPKKVKRTVEFWASMGAPAGARRRDPSGGSGGMYTYTPGANHQIHKYRSPHIALGWNGNMHQIVLDEIEDALNNMGA
jgi:hypothetical protein